MTFLASLQRFHARRRWASSRRPISPLDEPSAFGRSRQPSRRPPPAFLGKIPATVSSVRTGKYWVATAMSRREYAAGGGQPRGQARSGREIMEEGRAQLHLTSLLLNTSLRGEASEPREASEPEKNPRRERIHRWTSRTMKLRDRFAGITTTCKLGTSGQEPGTDGQMVSVSPTSTRVFSVHQSGPSMSPSPTSLRPFSQLQTGSPSPTSLRPFAQHRRGRCNTPSPTSSPVSSPHRWSRSSPVTRLPRSPTGTDSMRC